jgi:hypothetical protein
MRCLIAAIAVAVVLGIAGPCGAQDARAPVFAVTHSIYPVDGLKPWPATAPPVPLDVVLGRSFRTEAGEVRPDLIQTEINRWAMQALARPAVVRASTSAQQMDVPRRPVWSWPPSLAQWGVMPGPGVVAWQWQAGWQSGPSAAIRFASTANVAPIAPRPPGWVYDVSALTAEARAPSWPRVRAPDLRPPTEQRRVDIQEPPARYVRWTDRLETILPAGEVGRLCQAMAGKPPPAGNVYHGCAHKVAGRCLITRVEDPGVARHELAHCNGWPSGHPQ